MMVHPDSHRVSRAPWYSGTTPSRLLAFAYAAITLFGGAFQLHQLTRSLVTRRALGRERHVVLQPLASNDCRLDTDEV